jgi:small subunit ribosomal protein S17
MAEEENKEETEEQAEAQDAGSDAEGQSEALPPEGSDPSGDGDSEPEGSDPSGDAGPAEDSEPLDMHPKAVRRRRRSQASGEAGPSRDAEQRAADRAERRRRNAASRRRYRQGRGARSGEPGTGTPPAERESASQKVRQGIVISSKGDKTITVKVEHVGRHRRYEKVVRRSRTLHAHDESNQANEGDVVRVVETRPLSKTKHWRLVEILERAR